MRNLLYLDQIGQDYLQLDTVQINDEFYIEMSESDLMRLCCDNGLIINDGDLLIYNNMQYLGTVLER